jgi:hypothetical protein
MRTVAEHDLARYGTRFVSVDGSAEDTGLEDEVANLVTIGQALHWFVCKSARSELWRILTEPKHVCIVYNDRKEDDEIGQEYSNLVKKYSIGKDEIPNANDQYVARFLGSSDFKKFVLANAQRLDYEGMLGRLASASYMPGPDDEEWTSLAEDVKSLFTTRNEETVMIRYETRIYIGQLFPS